MICSSNRASLHTLFCFPVQLWSPCGTAKGSKEFTYQAHSLQPDEPLSKTDGQFSNIVEVFSPIMRKIIRKCFLNFLQVHFLWICFLDEDNLLTSTPSPCVHPSDQALYNLLSDQVIQCLPDTLHSYNNIVDYIPYTEIYIPVSIL